MDNNPQIMPKTKEEFWKVYWFSPLQMVEVLNPLEKDYRFMVEMRNFVIKAGAHEKMPGTVANVYLSNMTRILAQNDDQMGQLSDFGLLEVYYKSLIADVENMIKEDNSQPAYLANVPAHMRDAPTDETPPWQISNETAPSTIPETNSQMTNTYQAKPADQASVKAHNNAEAVNPTQEGTEKVREFEHEGVKYKMIVDKNDKEMFYKDGKLTSAAEYAKVASML